MMSDGDSQESCPQCGKKTTARRGSSLTQWILTADSCRCRMPTAGASATREASVTAGRLTCRRCGAPVAGQRKGTLTQWIFKRPVCKCETPLLPAPDEQNVEPVRAPIVGNEVPREGDTTPGDNETSGLFAGRYEIQTRLGTGNAAIVDKAFDRHLKKTVALKRLQQKRMTAAETMRFQKEAKVLAKLQHHNLVSVFDFGVSDGCPYLIMEYVEGKTLEQVLKERKVFKITHALRLTVHVGEALSEAHQKGVVHRDLKPRNIIVMEPDSDHPTVKLFDFGLARVETDDRRGLSLAGTPIGSPLYMSPEQVLGERADARSDIYSLGCILFQMLTGSPPYAAQTANETLIEKMNLPIPRLNERVPETQWRADLQETIDRALAKDPSNRFQSVEEFCKALGDIYFDEDSKQSASPATSVPQTSASSVQPLEKGTRAKNLTIYAVLTGVCVLSVAGLTFLHRNSAAPTADSGIVAPKAAAGNEPQHPSGEKSYMLNAIPNSYGGVEKDGDLAVRQLASRPDAQLIRRLILDGSIHLTDNACETLSLLKNLAILKISETDVTNKGLAYLERLPNLEHLCITKTKITDAGCESLGRMTKLKVIDMKWNNLSDAGLMRLHTLRNMQEFQVEGNKLSDRGCAMLVKNMPKIWNLDLASTQVTDECIVHLKVLKVLNNLNLSNCRISDQACETLSSIPSLKRLWLQNTEITDDGLKDLEKLNHLLSIDLTNCKNISGAGVNHFEKALPNCTVIGFYSEAAARDTREGKIGPFLDEVFNRAKSSIPQPLAQSKNKKSGEGTKHGKGSSRSR